MTDFTAAELRMLRAAMLGLPGHQAGAAESAKVYARYAELRARRLGPVPAREQLGGVQNGLAGESPLVRRLFSASR